MQWVNTMKLLIVDDEKLTREGIISNINWSDLGIQEIYEADDGFNGIEMGRKHKPDIILSDVRMPRKNGIEMARELHKLLPFASIIFMSGYSDKEYLMEAIKLKAVNYVEKPIEEAEMEASIKDALEEQSVHARNKMKSEYHFKESQNRLGLKIIYPFTEEASSDYQRQLMELGYPIKPGVEFTTLIITLKTPLSALSEAKLNELYMKIDGAVKDNRLQYILSLKNDEYLLLHLLSRDKTRETALEVITRELASFLEQHFTYYIAIGKTVKGVKKVYESYNSAVLLLQSSFFYEYNSIIQPHAGFIQPVLAEQSLYSAYVQALKHQNREESLEIITDIYKMYQNNQSMIPSYAKDFYYKLFFSLVQTASELHLQNFYEKDSAYILEYLLKDKNLSEFHRLLTDKLILFFSSLRNKSKENSVIYAIKEYISRNYQNETLSVKDISEQVYLSSSYVCTLFKNETGKTLNQYLTEYRIEKAKAMLKDSRVKITDISSKVGYSDSNYFSKTFKRNSNLSPSEYREKYGK